MSEQQVGRSRGCHQPAAATLPRVREQSRGNEEQSDEIGLQKIKMTLWRNPDTHFLKSLFTERDTEQKHFNDNRGVRAFTAK